MSSLKGVRVRVGCCTTKDILTQIGRVQALGHRDEVVREVLAVLELLIDWSPHILSGSRPSCPVHDHSNSDINPDPKPDVFKPNVLPNCSQALVSDIVRIISKAQNTYAWAELTK